MSKVGKNAIKNILRPQFHPLNSEIEIRQLCRITAFLPLPFASGRIGGAKRSQVDKDMTRNGFLRDILTVIARSEITRLARLIWRVLKLFMKG